MIFALNPNIKSLFQEEVSVFSFEHQKNSLEKNMSFFEDWLSQNAHAQMHFLSKNKDIRRNPNLILKDVKTALIFLFPYSYGNKIRSRLGNEILSQNILNENSLISKKLISKYVYGKDYHKVLKKKLDVYANELKDFLQLDFAYRAVVDSVPFFDRAHAKEAGLGFIGKNTMLIRPGIGSFFFIASLLTSVPIDKIAHKLTKKNALQDLDCGSCTKCLDACPTRALEKPYFLNANKCLSYLSIEHRDVVEPEFLPYFKDTLYGCDICQNVCPYNAISLDSKIIPEFAKIHEPFGLISVEQIAQMTKEQYSQWFGGTAATRAKYEGLVRNALYHLAAIDHNNLKSLCTIAQQNTNSILIKKTIEQILQRL